MFISYSDIYWDSRIHCNIGPKYLVSERKESARMKHSKLKIKEENSSRFNSWGLQRVVVKKKSLFDSVLLPSTSWVDRSVVIAALLIRSYQLYLTGWVCTGRGVLDHWRTCLETCLELPQISFLDFLYRDFIYQFEGSRRLGDTSENKSEAPESSCVIILKSRLNSTSHSACTR